MAFFEHKLNLLFQSSRSGRHIHEADLQESKCGDPIEDP